MQKRQPPPGTPPLRASDEGQAAKEEALQLPQIGSSLSRTTSAKFSQLALQKESNDQMQTEAKDREEEATEKQPIISIPQRERMSNNFERFEIQKKAFIKSHQKDFIYNLARRIHQGILEDFEAFKRDGVLRRDSSLRFSNQSKPIPADPDDVQEQRLQQVLGCLKENFTDLSELKQELSELR